MRAKLKLTWFLNNSYVLIKYLQSMSYFVLSNEVSVIDLCKHKAIINHIIELANQWLPEVATPTLIGVELCVFAECEAFTYSLGITPSWRKLPLEGVILLCYCYCSNRSVTTVLNVLYRMILTNLSCTTIKNFMCAMLINANTGLHCRMWVKCVSRSRSPRWNCRGEIEIVSWTENKRKSRNTYNLF